MSTTARSGVARSQIVLIFHSVPPLAVVGYGVFQSPVARSYDWLRRSRLVDNYHRSGTLIDSLDFKFISTRLRFQKNHDARADKMYTDPFEHHSTLLPAPCANPYLQRLPFFNFMKSKILTPPLFKSVRTRRREEKRNSQQTRELSASIGGG
ncbi:hypothetical protein EVAR_97067_1 [Eumeta japonica]|uniref:Uncharacterized protein n=1 Tax=Eumeta variegata TaxID=151549 RepID=A0A4C1T409_EUMVA|nr:hypothetical protein EVAR_97067_1 [Eumeta japonica]